MRFPRVASFALALSMVSVPTSVLAQDATDEGDPPEPVSSEHFELTMGFLVGERGFSSLTFASGSNDPVAADLVAPFRAAPFDQVLVLGLRWELRLVVSHVRMTVGFDLPFTRYSVADTTDSFPSGDLLVVVTTRSLQPWEVRFGIGGEHAFGPVVPFVDLIGAVHGADATLAIDGVGERGYQAIGFGFSIRPGVRFMASEWLFVQTSAQIGLGSPVVWDAELSVGFWIG